MTGSQSDEDLGPQKPSHLGKSAQVKGEISLDEDLCIEGEFEGGITIRGKKLNIDKEAVVKGDMRASTIEVYGTVEGDVHAEELVHLYGTASVGGSIYCKRVIVEDGARFDGQFIMSTDATKPAGNEPILKSVSS
jgi:cytoskeletal protein CcmA (bactofilin family)